MNTFNLKSYAIACPNIFRNPSPATLYERALINEQAVLSDSGALIAYSGEKTGRVPRDKRIVDGLSRDDIWWGPVNTPLREESFHQNRVRAIEYLSARDYLYCIDAFAGWDPDNRISVRVICSRAYHALFMHNMLIRPTDEELENFGEPDFVIYNAGQCEADISIEGVNTTASINISFEEQEIVILGTEYAGEMKKGVFSVMNYLMPKKGNLSMHCSVTESKSGGNSSVFFGLSGTGKTTLSADPQRLLIGDDEHVWSSHGLSNIEGGCYAKALKLSAEQEPDIFNAIRFGSVLENVIYDMDTRIVDYDDDGITQNTRASYPIEFISNAKIPCITVHPKNVVFLTCDAFGVLPPVSVLSPDQAAYHFMSGYTAKVAGTEEGVKEPQATFSPCFGGPFLAWHPQVYAELLSQKITAHNAKVWLVNTGWTGGSYGTGERMSLTHTRAIISAIHDGALSAESFETDPCFGFRIPEHCPGVPDEILDPQKSWSDAALFEATRLELAKLFIENFKQYENCASDAVCSSGPRL